MADPINAVSQADVDRFGLEMSMNSFQKVATQSAIYPGQGTSLGLSYAALKLNGEAGELAEHVGKAMRDDGMASVLGRDTAQAGIVARVKLKPLKPERHDLIVKEVGDCLWYLSALCHELGITLGEAALVNLQKIAGRTERGTLQGSGDNR